MNAKSINGMSADVEALLSASSHEPLLLTRDGKPVAVLLGLGDDEELASLELWLTPRFQDILERSRAQLRAGQGFEHTDFWDRVEAEHDSC